MLEKDPTDLRVTLSDVYRTVPVHARGPFWQRLAAFTGPGYLVAVGYMDPGNWATDLAGGSAFGYALLSVILFSNLIAIFLQAVSLRLGIATGRDLAQASADHFNRPVRIFLWLLSEIAICATDLAEVIGTAIALNLLFKIPLIIGIIITALDVFLLLGLQRFGFRKLEAFVISLFVLIAICFGYNLWLAQPDMAEILRGFLPVREIITNHDMLYIAMGILGATVMPHNLYLHSAIVQTRSFAENPAGKRNAIRFASIDSFISLTFAFFVNCAILILAASVFHQSGHADVAEIGDAYHLLTPLLGSHFAATAFGIALLACGLNSTATATLAGQVVMEGFLNIRLPGWARRIITRSIAIVPAAITAIYYGESGTAKLLVFSQVILSLQLPFAIVPLLMFAADRKKMGEFTLPRWANITGALIAGVIILLNGILVWDFFKN